jgi:hypothetical protein
MPAQLNSSELIRMERDQRVAMFEEFAEGLDARP